MKQLTWHFPGLTLGPHDIETAQEMLGVRFPDDYACMLSRHDGANNPDESEFKFAVNGRARVGNFGTLLSIREGEAETLFQALADLGEQLPAGVLPIVETGCGDCVCLDFRRAENGPTIAYFAHEKAEDEALIPLAKTFSDFLDMLETPEHDG